MPNRLLNENSPYLIQHANNPVEWYPWGPEALERAKSEDKPIFLSIGYAACHWCHVMAHESFEDDEVARLMNKHFINIKVDREERPDLDGIYMNAVVAMTGSGGWPMSVFLTPDGKPFFGGTYFPPVPRYKMPSFREVLLSIARLWQEDRERLIQSGESLKNHMADAMPIATQVSHINPNILNHVVFQLAQSYDWEHGGWGQAPKFPQPMIIEFLVLSAIHGDRIALDMAVHTLDAMAKGGMYDIIGGGFARYSTDDFWLVPHFEKMLYDNAQLALAYLHAFLVTNKYAYRDVCIETLDFISRELADPGGGFFSSLDADSDGVEGKYYFWSYEELKNLLKKIEWDLGHLSHTPSARPSELFTTAFGITTAGNFDGNIVLQRQESSAHLTEKFGLSEEEIDSEIARMKQMLYEVRGQRNRPALDDKVLISWNALAMMAFSEAGRYLNRDDYIQIARKNADFLLNQMQRDGSLKRSWRSGAARHNAYLEDYASLILGLLSLFQVDPDLKWFLEASRLANEMLLHFQDPSGGFYDTRDDHETLIVRPKDLQDNAVPCGNSMAAVALTVLTAYTGNSEWHEIAERMLFGVHGYVLKYPQMFGKWLHAFYLHTHPIAEIALIGNSDQALMQAFRAVLKEEYRPYTVVAESSFPIDARSPALLHGRIPMEGNTTAYVCRNFSCLLPASSPDLLRAQLKSAVFSG